MNLQNALKIKAEAKRLFMNKLSELKRAELSPKYETIDYSKLPHKELKQICKEQKIQYAPKMKKHEMVSILSQNDPDPSKLVRPEVYNRMAIYRDNPERRQIARECSARWRQNNREKALQNWKKFNKDYARKTSREFNAG